MRHSLVLMFAVCLVMGTSGSAAAAPSPIAVTMGDLRWGMTENEVIAHVKRKLADRYAEQLKAARSESKKSQLKSELKRALSELQSSQVRFDGRRSRWDSSPIAGEFAYDNGESMVSYKDGSSENYYFFVHGRLWKWFKAYGSSAFGGGNFKKFAKSTEKTFGKGRAKQGELNAGRGQTQWIEYLDRNSRLRAADVSKSGVFALIFEEMATVRELASTRGTPAKGGYGNRSDDDASDSDRVAGTGVRAEIAQAQKRKSVFADESSRQESEGEYQARQRREAAEARQRQERMHARKQDAKKGEALKPLEGLDDKDPLGGL